MNKNKTIEAKIKRLKRTSLALCRRATDKTMREFSRAVADLIKEA